MVELADLRGHPARANPPERKTACCRWLGDELAATGILSAGDRAKEVMLLTEGAMALVLILAIPSWANSAARAARKLLQTYQTARAGQAISRR